MKRKKIGLFWKFSVLFFSSLLFVFALQSGCGGGTTKTDKDGGGKEQPTSVDGGGCKTNADCPTGQACLDGECKVPECTSDSECQGGVCKNGKCEKKQDQCQSAGDCPPGQDCVDEGGAKVCKKTQGASKVAKVVILTPGGVIRQGQKKQFEAAAYNKSGARIQGKLQFKWSSSDSAVVSIDQNTGLATGGNKNGTAQITAEVDGVKSAPVSLRNFAALPQGEVRIVLIDAKGKGIQGAKVVIGSKSADSDADGVVNFKNLKPPFDIHIYHKNFSYLSIFHVNKSDLLIQLPPDKGTQKGGGVEGKFKFDNLKKLLNIKNWDDRNVGLGIAGLSISESLFSLDFKLLLGEQVEVQIVGKNTKVPMGVYLELPTGGKPYYKAQSTPGRKVLWGFGGKFELGTLLALIPQGGGSIDIGTILAGAKPLFKEMGFGYSPDIEVQEGKFNKKDLFLNYVLDQKLTINVAKVPTVQHKGKPLKLLVVGLTGVLLPGSGLLPLGLMIEQGDGGKSVTLEVNHAARTGILKTGKQLVVTLAFNLVLNKTKDSPPIYVFGDVQFTSSNSVSVPSFIGIPDKTKASFNPNKRSAGGYTVSNASLYHFSFTSPSGKEWFAIIPNSIDYFRLPKPPSGFSDPIGDKGSASIRAVVLKSGLTMDSVLEFNDTNMDQLNEIVRGFSNMSLYEKK